MYDKYVNLRVFSHFTIGTSVAKPKHIVKFAVTSGANMISICDKMNLFGAPEFSNECIKNKIKPIIGCVIQTNLGDIPVFIKNQDGFVFLSKLLTDYYFYKMSEISIEKLISPDIIVLTGTDSIFYTSSGHNKEDWLKTMKEMFGENLYIEIANLPGRNELINLADKLKIPIVITNPVYYCSPKNLLSFHLIKALHDGVGFNPDVSESEYKNNYLMTAENISTIINFPQFQQEIINTGLENSDIIAKKCSFYLKTIPQKIPRYSDGDENSILREYSMNGLNKRLEKVPKELHEDYYKRLEYELGVLTGKNFSGYFLITQDYVKYARENGILVGPGRGSGAGSLVAYSLGITNVDPMHFKLIFERFLNPGRPSMPDFDIDFDPERREDVIKYVASKFGEMNVVSIATFGFLQARGAFKEAARAFKLSHSEANQICSLIPQDQINPVSLEDALKIVPNLKEMQQSSKYVRIFDLALQIEGICKNLSKHAAGIIITDEDIWRTCPLKRDDHGELVTQFSMKYAEQAGLIKFDFLGLRTLTILQETSNLIKKLHGIDVEIYDVPLDDPATFDIFTSCNLEGVFQFENPNLKDIIRDLKPSNIWDLIALNALNRPGPFDSIPTYIKRKHGQEEVDCFHPLLEETLRETFGVLVYQEQVMAAAVLMSGYTMAEADDLRRAMGKKQFDEMERQKNKFIEGAMKNNVERKTAELIFNKMYEFAGYGFNKAHSTTYSIISYYCAYMKAHFFLEFMATIMSIEYNNSDKLFDYITNLNEQKIIVLPVCVNFSNANFNIEEGCIRYGLKALKGLGSKLSEHIESDRNKNGKYISLSNFVTRNSGFLDKRQIESLIKSGALDNFGNRKDMFENSSAVLSNDYIPKTEEWDFFTKKNYEAEVIGFYLISPFTHYRRILTEMGCYSIEKAKKEEGYCYVTGVLAKVRRRRIADKSSYAFLEIYDESGTLHLICFSNTLERYTNLLVESKILIFRIKKDSKNKYSIVEVHDLDNYFASFSRQLTINISDKNDLQTVSEILKDFPGYTKIFFKIDQRIVSTSQTVRDCIVLRERLKKFLPN